MSVRQVALWSNLIAGVGWAMAAVYAAGMLRPIDVFYCVVFAAVGIGLAFMAEHIGWGDE